jgi:hypothetical protein
MSRAVPVSALPIPTESEEQITLFQWATLQAKKYPELSLMFHIANGGSRSKAEAGRFKAEGVKAGVPDICLPVARGNFHGLFIELKRQKNSHTSDYQKNWIQSLSEQGYLAVVCKGWFEASETIVRYLDLKGEASCHPER